MPVIAFEEALDSRPSRVLVAGTSGSGKTRLASRIAAILDIPHVEIDALFHGSGWTPRPTFEAEVRAFSAQPAWVTEWQYSQVRPLLASRADLVVWLDLPRRTVMRQVVRRTVRRRLRREVLWNGNVEPALRTILHDREHIVRSAWSTHHKAAARIHELAAQRPDVPIVRLRNHQEAGHWLEAVLEATASRSS